MLTLLVLTCHAQPPQSGTRNRGRASRDTLFRLLEIPSVRTELGMQPFQIEVLDDLQADLGEQRRAAFSGDQGWDDAANRGGAELSDQAARERFDAMRTAVQSVRAQGEKLIAVILNADQNNRLNELRLQNEGTRALDRAELRAQLNVTDEQFEQIRQLRQAENEAGTTRSRRSKQLDARVLALLNPEQQVHFKALQGEAFEFPLVVPADLRGLRGPQDGQRSRRRRN